MQQAGQVYHGAERAKEAGRGRGGGREGEEKGYGWKSEGERGIKGICRKRKG